MKLPPKVGAGEKVEASWANGLIDWLRANRITSVINGRLTPGGGGSTLYVNPGGHALGRDLFSFRVSRKGPTTLRIAAGDVTVIHFSRTRENETEMLGVNTTGTLFRVYTYGGVMSDWQFGAPPNEAVTHRVFCVADIECRGENIFKIIHRHLGDLEVYDVGCLAI